MSDTAKMHAAISNVLLFVSSLFTCHVLVHPCLWVNALIFTPNPPDITVSYQQLPVIVY